MGHHGTWAVAALLAAALFAGCFDTPAPPPVRPAPSPFLAVADLMQADRFYSFRHEGGPLAFRLGPDSAAQVELFDDADMRVGDYGLSRAGAASDVRFDDLAPGAYVVRLTALNGSIAIESAGQPALLWPLSGHVERLVVAQGRSSPLPGLPFLSFERIEAPLRLNLTRAPTALRLLADGSFGSVDLTLSGAGGEVFRVQGAGDPVGLWQGLRDVPGVFHAERALDKRLEGLLVAEDLQGSLILEAVSFSRALPPGQALVGTRAGPPAFTYGLLPSAPVAFQVAPGARQLVLWSEAPVPAAGDAPPAWVAVFDGQDRKLASVPVYAGTYTTLAVPGGGRFVAALLQGNATLGADVAPADFGLEPLRTVVAELPPRAAGRPGEYGQDNATIEPKGVLYAIEPAILHDPVPFAAPVVACPPDAALRILQGGEVAAAWGSNWGVGTEATGVRLGAGPVTLWHDGFGDSGCPRTGAAVLAYVR